MSLADRAFEYALAAHGNQVRKYTGEPYIHHPIAVAELLRDLGYPQVVIAAAYLHDVVEDCEGQSIELITRTFGPDIGMLVDWMTCRDFLHPHWNRDNRKMFEAGRLYCAPADAQTIKLADMYDNTFSIVEHDPKFAKVYLAEKQVLVEHLTRGHPLLRQRVKKQIEEGFQQIYKGAA